MRSALDCRHAVLRRARTPLHAERADDEEEPGVVSLDTLIKGTCRPARFLDIVENFIVFEEGKHGLVKKLVKTHQSKGGIAVSYEAIRRWVNYFGPKIAMDLRTRRPKPHTVWHLDEVYLKIGGRTVYL
jgi:hypothetical protein